MIPLLDLRDGDVVDRLAHAYETFGFAQVVGHGVDQALVDAVFEASDRFHALPEAEKARVALDRNHRGHIAIATSTDRRSEIESVTRPNQSESFMMMRDAGPDDPDVQAGHYLAGPNQWPALDGFRDTLEEFEQTMAPVARRILGLFLDALGGVSLPPGALDPPTVWLRLLRYPPRAPERGLYGSAPHVDFGAVTLLAQDDVGGLQVRGEGGNWIDVAPMRGAFVLNIGAVMRHWSGGRFVATPHRVLNHPSRVRRSVAYFLDPHVTTTVDTLVGDSERRPYVFGDFLRTELEAGYDRHSPTR